MKKESKRSGIMEVQDGGKETKIDALIDTGKALSPALGFARSEGNVLKNQGRITATFPLFSIASYTIPPPSFFPPSFPSPTLS